jgi:hypothetical protein
MIWHVAPINDIKEHEMGFECTCDCGVSVQEVDGDLICVHSSYDGREAVEWTKEIINIK